MAERQKEKRSEEERFEEYYKVWKRFCDRKTPVKEIPDLYDRLVELDPDVVFYMKSYFKYKNEKNGTQRT